MKRVAIIGAGAAGLSAALALRSAGCAPTLFDKGRRPGGRMAAARTPDGHADHGAQFVRTRDADFRSALDANPNARRWSALDRDGRAAYAGSTSIRAIAEHWAAGLDLRCSTIVTALAAQAHGWKVHAADAGDGSPRTPDTLFDACILTLPAPQAEALLDASSVSPTWRPGLAKISYDPCWTLVAKPTRDVDVPDIDRPPAPFSWCVAETMKPERRIDAWVMQANAAWSREHLEWSNDQAAASLLQAIEAHAGVPFEPLRTQRWRYARVRDALGQSALADGTHRLFYASDGCLGGRVESAWLSGEAAATELLAPG